MKIRFRKIFLMIFVALISLFLNNKDVFAALNCIYDDGKIHMEFEIFGDGTVSRVKINGEIKSTDETNIKNETEPLENWDSEYETDFTGKSYYEKHKKCPPYLAFFDGSGHFNVYAGETEAELKKIKKEYDPQGWSGAVKNKPISSEELQQQEIHEGEAAKSCAGFTDETSCTKSTDPVCVWDKEDGFCSVNGLTYLSCGDAKDIPPVAPKLTSYAVTILKVVTPIILILIGIIGLIKAMSSSEDEMKKAQSKLIKKVVAAIMVFFVITIVQFVILKVADSGEAGSVKKCLKCFLNNDCDGSKYYKDGYGWCYYVNSSEAEECE